MIERNYSTFSASRADDQAFLALDDVARRAYFDGHSGHACSCVCLGLLRHLCEGNRLRVAAPGGEHRL